MLLLLLQKTANPKASNASGNTTMTKNLQRQIMLILPRLRTSTANNANATVTSTVTTTANNVF